MQTNAGDGLPKAAFVAQEKPLLSEVDRRLFVNTSREICALIEQQRQQRTLHFGPLVQLLAARIASAADSLVAKAEARKKSGHLTSAADVTPHLEAVPSLSNVTSVLNGLSIDKKVIKRVKIFVPEVPNYNFIGRILGPRGISVRQLEEATGCGVLIRGKGSVKNAEREERLRSRNTPGFEHLKEPLHVLITAQGHDDADCDRKLEVCKRRIDKLLKPEYDEFKRQQLTQLAMINGTYTPCI
uniref:KH domain-containing protein n=1 Tax=Panagrellus redivivus TaxID=6233 RepID=A0A7E4UXE7_PANRE